MRCNMDFCFLSGFPLKRQQLCHSGESFSRLANFIMVIFLELIEFSESRRRLRIFCRDCFSLASIFFAWLGRTSVKLQARKDCAATGEVFPFAEKRSSLLLQKRK